MPFISAFYPSGKKDDGSGTNGDGLEQTVVSDDSENQHGGDRSKSSREGNFDDHDDSEEEDSDDESVSLLYRKPSKKDIAKYRSTTQMEIRPITEGHE